MTSKRILVVLASLAALALAGCAQEEQDEVEEDGAPTVETLPYRSDRVEEARLELPVWQVGDEWVYEIKPQEWETLCADTPSPRPFVSRDLVVGEGTRHDLADEPEIYRVRSYLRGCAGESIGERDRDWVRSHLAVIDDKGRWEPKLAFPLEDGKRWSYKPEGGIEVTAESTYLPRYAWADQEVEAWAIVLKSERAEERTWFGVDARNVLLRETWREEGETLKPFGTLRLVSYRPAT